MMAVLDPNVDSGGGLSDYDQMVMDAYASIGRTGIGAATNQIDPEGYNFWLGKAQELSPDDFANLFDASVSTYFQEKPQDPYTDYVSDYLVRNLYDDIGRTGIGTDPNQIDQEGYDYWRNQLMTGALSPEQLDDRFYWAVENAVTSPESQTPAPIKDYVVDYLRQNPVAQIKLPARTPATSGTSGGVDQIGDGGSSGGSTNGTPVTLERLGTFGASNGGLLGAGNAEYQSPLIQALRQSNQPALNSNSGFSLWDTTGGGQQGTYSTDSGGAFSPQILQSPVASSQDTADWNAYSAYRTSSLQNKMPIMSFDQWKAQQSGAAATTDPTIKNGYDTWQENGEFAGTVGGGN